MNEHQVVYYLANKYLNKDMQTLIRLKGTLRIDANQFWVNRNINWGNHHNIEIIRIKTKKPLTKAEHDELKSELKTSLNRILKSIQGSEHKPVLNIILKYYHSCNRQIIPSLFPNSTHQ
jgi:hypothetical protein